jgi:two-component system, NarL family, invasion response regulator UvrY
MDTAISLALVDDHTIVRNGLKSLIEVMGDYKVIAQFDNGRHFVESHPLSPEPDVVIMDLNMPDMNGLEAVRWLRKNKSTLKVLILTLEHEERTIIELFRLGVRGYLPKSCNAAVLKKAIDDTVNTGYYHSDILQNALIAETDHSFFKHDLSDKERQFLQLVCHENEHTYEQIADIMNVSKRTVDNYREALFQKFDIKSKTGLVLFAIKHRLAEI